MRKRLLIVLLGLALAGASVFPFGKSKAARVTQERGASTATVESQTKTLPNYDIRLVDKGEFMDVALNTSADTQRAAQSGNAALQARAAAIENFRAGLSPEAARNLHADVNEAGVMKNFFIDGAALSEPKADTADNVARGFLHEQAALFSLSDAAINGLKLTREDLDRGTTFLNYVQTVGGYKVFEGGVQVVVNGKGEVLNVREGFLVSGQSVRLKPALTEAQGIAKAFEHAGHTVAPSFVETQRRANRSEALRDPLIISPKRNHV